MTTKKGKQPAVKAVNNGLAQQANSKESPFVARYVAVDSHLTERNGSTDAVYGLAGERPAGRKLAQDIANTCNQLHNEGYEVISIIPLTSGRTVEATVEAAERVHGRTYSEEGKHYVDTSAGYSVTDGVIITARLRQ